MSEDLVLSLRHVTSGYRDGGLFRRGAVQEVLHDVSFDVRHGEILGLVGESGSGKSVTAMAVAGLLPRRQCRYSGRILLDGTELLHADRAQLRRVQGKAIGVVFQEPMTSMDPLMKVGRHE